MTDGSEGTASSSRTRVHPSDDDASATSTVGAPKTAVHSAGSIRRIKDQAGVPMDDGWRPRVQSFLDDPNSSPQASVFAVGMLLTIIASVATMCVGSYPSHASWANGPQEWAFNVIFTIEFAVRCAAATDLKNLYLDAYMYFDFFAVVPFWAEKIGAVLEFETEGAFFKILMALRMLRLLKISRQYDGSIVIVRALKVRRARRALASSPRSGLKAELSLSLSRCRSPRSARPSSSSWSP